jgi:NADH-quinone oxidoreductase subunit J
MLFSLAFFFSFFSILTSIMVIISSNPVHSVFFLIMSFVLVCGNIFLLELEFLPLILIVIYVGAISVLFLFIVMMLDIKFVEKKQKNMASVLIGVFFAIFFCLIVFINLKNTIFFNFNSAYTNFNWINFIDKLINLNSIGQYLYLDFVVHFLVVGLILLVAIIGAVVLTLQLNNLQVNKSQHLFKQVARTNLETFYIIK